MGASWLPFLLSSSIIGLSLGDRGLHGRAYAVLPRRVGLLLFA